MDFDILELKVTEWASERGIYSQYSDMAQIGKLAEEFAELITAIKDNSNIEIWDAIGDMLVVLTNIAYKHGSCLKNCYKFAYDQIKDRKGKMVNGTFVKEE